MVGHGLEQDTARAQEDLTRVGGGRGGRGKLYPVGREGPVIGVREGPVPSCTRPIFIEHLLCAGTEESLVNKPSKIPAFEKLTYFIGVGRMRGEEVDSKQNK